MGRSGFVTDSGCWDDRQTEAAKEIEDALDGLDFVRVAFCDLHGLARSKTVPAAVFRDVLRNGMDFSPGPFVFDTGHAVAVDFLSDDPQVGVPEISGAGDFVLVPDPLTFQVLPGTDSATAWVLGDEYLRDGTPHPLSPRRVLRRVVDAYAARERVPVVGLEVEWYLTRLLDGPAGNAGNGFGSQGAAPAVAAMNAGYQFNLDSFYDTLAPVLEPLALRLQQLGLPLRSMEHESGPGQVETTFAPMTALDAADAMVLFRTVVKQFCHRSGHHASFMTLPRVDGFDPSGWHLHQSVMSTRTGRNVFPAEGGAPGELSPEGAGYLGGLLAGARELMMLSVPTVNGYRRMGAQYTLSPGAADFSAENRTVMVRLLGEGASTHLENRVGEPTANPYLAMAAQLSAGLEGIPAGATAPAGPDSTDGPVRLPASLREALDAFRAGDRAARLLGEPLTACLTRLKESEAARFEEWYAANGVDGPGGDTVTEWEHREYFRVF